MAKLTKNLSKIRESELLRVRICDLPLTIEGTWLAGCVVGVVIGFPLCSSLAMRTLPASHGAVINGLLPFATALPV